MSEDEKKTFPARLHVLLRKKSAVVLRRGLARHVASIGWNLETDTFTLGQWLHGRIYEYRCDLSPDGKFLIYFAAKYGRLDAVQKRVDEFLAREFKNAETWRIPWGVRERAADAFLAEHAEEFAKLKKTLEFQDCSWTAISRAPYLKAVELWFNGSGWNGGGLFMDNRKVWLNHPKFMNRVPVLSSGKFEILSEPEPVSGECPPIYFSRLERDGWVLKYSDEESSRYNVLFEKPLPHRRVLRKTFHSGFENVPGRGVYWDDHQLADSAGTLLADGKRWEWADYDSPRRRIVFAQGGCLFALRVGKTLGEPVLLKDFNAMKFAAVPAPY